MKTGSWFSMPLLLVAGTLFCAAQSNEFNLEAYKQFLANHQNLQASQLEAMYPAGFYSASVAGAASPPVYLDTIIQKYGLTSYEQQLLGEHGFVVTSRLATPTFIGAFANVFYNDLPVFISADAILQAIHQSYDKILMYVEISTLRPAIVDVLAELRGQLPSLVSKYGDDPRMQPMLRDVDVYVSVPQILLGEATGPYFADNTAWVNTLLQYAADLQPHNIALFAETERSFDFSQFTVRGHYTQDSLLASYFRAMMWLGRTEIYLLEPGGTTTEWPKKDIQRQIIDAALVLEAARAAGVLTRLQEVDQILQFMVGESDNVTPEQLQELLDETAIANAGALLDNVQCKAFQDHLATKPYATQQILSQIVMTDPMDPDQIRPPAAFLLMGQRFVIDSYVTGNVVYDKVVCDGEKVRRMLPSTLDVLFALGNNAAGQLLKPELERYHYASNAAANRYLVDSYPTEFWSASMFNAWLQMIRTLNPPEVKSQFPSFMQTAAWWQEKMNTQLASWAQLRHDNLLYAKQSYSGGITCSYPESFVEPIPQFFDAVKQYAEMAAEKFGALEEVWIQSYFLRLAATAETLGGIAAKELDGTPLTNDERTFLQDMLVLGHMCGDPFHGWYPDLFFGGYDEINNFVVADVHTAPTDEYGTPVGWVLHVGTGPVDMAILRASLPDGRECAFIGPVMSYYEHVATGFKRLTDEEWKTLYAVAPTLRPSFVNIYLAGADGGSRGEGPSLITGVEETPPPSIPASPVLYQNYPNPFNASTIIPFTVKAHADGEQTVLEVYNVLGQVVARLVDAQLPAGNYTVLWDGTTGKGVSAPSGVYFVRLMSGVDQQTRKMVLSK